MCSKKQTPVDCVKGPSVEQAEEGLREATVYERAWEKAREGLKQGFCVG